MAHDEEQGAKKGFKIVDHRRFDSQGAEKDADAGDPSTERSTGADAAARVSSDAQPVEQREAAAPSEPEELSFSAFLMSLATQVLMQLGEIAPPPGSSLAKDIEGARQTIDILAMLEMKTKGNLDQNEQYLIQEILHSLRIKFVEATTKGGK